MSRFSSRSILAALAVALFCASVQAQWRTFGDVADVQIKSGQTVVLSTTTGALIGFEAGDRDTVQIRYAPDGRFESTRSYSVIAPVKTMSAWTVEETPDAVVIKRNGPVDSAKTWIYVKKRPLHIELFDHAGETLVREDPDNPAVFNPKTGETRISFLRRGEMETYYGFGEKAFPGMSRHGEYIVNWNTDTYAYPQGLDPIYQSIPFFYALREGKAYGIFLNNTYRTFFDMGKTSPERYTFGADGGELDFYVLTGGEERSPANVLASYARLTGTGPLPPLWALGNQQSRWSYQPESRVREIASKFRELKIPLDVIYLDIDYMDGFRVFTWDKKKFPDPGKLISDLASEGIRTVLIIDPGIKVDENYDVYTDGRAKGIFVRNADGSEFNAPVWAGNSAFPDFTDPKARDWFSSYYRRHLDEGVAGFWNDMNEPATFMTPATENPRIYHHPDKTFPYDTRHAGDGSPGDHRRYHNVFGMQMARASYEGLRKLEPGKRPFVLTRAGFAGVQRFSAVWTGDNVASWEHLQLSIPMLANLSVSGVPFVGADVGGFSGVPSGELYTRWLQAAALTPFLRSHSETGVANKEAWEYGDEFIPVNRASVELRYRLLPYLYTQFYLHEDSGMPVMRPLWFNYPKDMETYLVADQYLVGKDILVAPVVRESERKRSVYFPKGDDWRDFETGELYKGGTRQMVDAPLERLPVFIRVGSVVPVQPPVQHTGLIKGAPITLLVSAGIGEGLTEEQLVFLDSGDGFGYRNGEFRKLSISHRRGTLRIDRTGSYRSGQKVAGIEVIGVGARPSEVAADGERIDFDYESGTGRLRFGVADDVRLVELKR